jgi:hypothetical protein
MLTLEFGDPIEFDGAACDIDTKLIRRVVQALPEGTNCEYVLRRLTWLIRKGSPGHAHWNDVYMICSERWGIGPHLPGWWYALMAAPCQSKFKDLIEIIDAKGSNPVPKEGNCLLLGDAGRSWREK